MEGEDFCIKKDRICQIHQADAHNLFEDILCFLQRSSFYIHIDRIFFKQICNVLIS